MYTQRLPAGGLPADDVPARRSAGAQPRPAGRASHSTQRRRTLATDPRAERGDARPGRPRILAPGSTPTTWPSRCRPRRPRSSTSPASRRRRSTSTASAVEPTDDYGRRCLLARRLVENGVRFVCVVSGGGPGNQQWDAHDDIEENHRRKAAETDQPDRRPAQGPEAPRPARQHAGRLGRRVRPLARGRVGQGPRPPQPRLHDVDGRRRHQGRPGRRRHRRHRPPRHRDAPTTSATSTRRSCTSSASTSTG